MALRTYSRRRVVASIGSAALWSACGDDAGPLAPTPSELEAFSDELLAVDRAQVFELIAGRDYDFVLEALHLAAVRVNDDRVGGRAHSIYGVTAADHVGERIGERWLALLWTADDVKRWQQEIGHAPVGALSESDIPAAATAREAFSDAVDTRFADAAEHAVVGVYRGLGPDAAVAAIHEAMLRRVYDFGHNAIRVFHGVRMLDRTGWGAATEHTLRMIARGLTELSDSEEAPLEDVIASVSPSWENGAYDLPTALTLLDVIRDASPLQAQQAVAEALSSGVDGEALWQAAYLLGPACVVAYTPNTLARHLFTSTDAHRSAYDAASTSEDRLRALLLTFANAAQIAETERVKFSLVPRPERLFDLVAQPGTPDDAWASADPVAAVAMMLDAVDAQGADRLLDDSLTASLEHMGDAHLVKFPLALAERHGHVDPSLARHFLAGLYVALGEADATPVWDRLDEARDLAGTL